MDIRRSLNILFLSLQFLVAIEKKEHEGLYNLFFHNCHNYEINTKSISVNLTVRTKRKLHQQILIKHYASGYSRNKSSELRFICIFNESS